MMVRKVLCSPSAGLLALPTVPGGASPVRVRPGVP